MIVLNIGVFVVISAVLFAAGYATGKQRKK